MPANHATLAIQAARLQSALYDAQAEAVRQDNLPRAQKIAHLNHKASARFWRRYLSWKAQAGPGERLDFKRGQSQQALTIQLQQLIPAANILGLYDAADYLKNVVEAK